MQAAQLFNRHHLHIPAFGLRHMGLDSMRDDRQRILSGLLHHRASNTFVLSRSWDSGL